MSRLIVCQRLHALVQQGAGLLVRTRRTASEQQFGVTNQFQFRVGEDAVNVERDTERQEWLSLSDFLARTSDGYGGNYG